MSDQLNLIQEEADDDGLTDLQRLMSKKAEDHTQQSIYEIAKILRERRNLYALEEAEKASKPAKAPKEPKEPKAPKVDKAPAKPKSNADKVAGELAGGLGDLLGGLDL